MASMDADAGTLVIVCVRCAAALGEHPHGTHARYCPGCGRDRGPDAYRTPTQA